MMAEAGEEEEAMEIEDLVPVINRNHFEEAMSKARISVTKTDLQKYDDFRRKFDPIYAASRGAQTTVAEFQWPEREEQFKPAEDEEEDFYA
jgi:transitional endoplasmic reticulum ATPase